jgi:LysR family transcriptional regulator of abg operon
MAAVDVDLNKLERMVAIYEAGSFRKAAKALGLTQSTLTWSIQQLEESLNSRLFERGPGGIQPTELCERLVRRARLIFREHERLLGEVDANTHRQLINIGVHPMFLTPNFADCIAEFSKKWPNVTIRIREGFSSDLIERLLRGEFDFACCVLPTDYEKGSSLDLTAVAHLKYSVVARADHPVFDDIAKGASLHRHPWVEFDVAILGSPGTEEMQAVFERVGLSIEHRSVRTASMNLIRLMILSGHFIGLIADERVTSELESGALKRLPNAMLVDSEFGFVSLQEDFQSNAVQALKAILTASAFDPFNT